MRGQRRTADGAARALVAPVWLAVVAAIWLVPAAAAAAKSASPVPATKRLNVTVTLKPRDPAALAAYAREVSTPGSDLYRAYLTPAQFARRFGAMPKQIAAVRRSLAARGLHPGKVSAGGLSIPLHATAAQVEHGFSVSLRELSFPGRRTAVAATASPVVGAGLSGVVQSVVGLSGTPAPRPLLQRPALLQRLALVQRPGALQRPATADALAGAPLDRAHVATGGPQPCAAASGSAPGQDAYTADQIAFAYGFSGLYGAGDEGAGVTVGVYELEPDDPNDIATFQSCYGTHASVSYARVDGGAGSGAGSGEAAIDIENTIGLAPDANILVYQGPNGTANGPGSGPYDIFSAMVNQDRARVISVSWGDCEEALGQPDAIAENTLFMQAAIQGQSVVAASGDSGSEDCDTPGSVPDTELAVDDPASQPFVTGVGGTSLRALGPRPTETVWNSGGSLAGAVAEPGAGGGGFSDFWPMPAAQLNASSSLGVRSASGSGCGNLLCRAVPDVAADADPTTGYLVYWNGSGSATGQSGWQGFGGTSAGTPVWGALLALADASRACAESPVGFANPALYRAAGLDYGADFNDVTSGNDDFTGTAGGQYAARPGYDEATGLGTPNAATLAAALCTQGVRLATPRSQRSAVRSTVSLQLSAQDAPGNKLSYQATGLPPGLKLSDSSGRITGKPRLEGSFTVRIGASDSAGSAAPGTFTWTIGAATRLSKVKLTRGSRPTLAFTVSAGRGAPALSTLRVTAPRGLRFASRRGLGMNDGAAHRPRRVRFSARLAHGVLTLKLRKTSGSVRVIVGKPGLQILAARVSKLARRASAPRLTVTVVDAGAGTSRLSAAVPGAAR
jgi:subtilase family serine protease